ncbi:unnamed protein product, partial [Rotaria magnacalcarata]
NCGSERAAPSYALHIHFSSVSINCNKRSQRCKSHHQSPLSVETFTSLDDDEELTGGFIVDNGLEARFVCSDENASTFFVLL